MLYNSAAKLKVDVVRKKWEFVKLKEKTIIIWNKKVSIRIENNLELKIESLKIKKLIIKFTPEAKLNPTSRGWGLMRLAISLSAERSTAY